MLLLSPSPSPEIQTVVASLIVQVLRQTAALVARRRSSDYGGAGVRRLFYGVAGRNPPSPTGENQRRGFFWPLRVSLSPFFSVLAGDFSAPARSEAAPAVLTAGGPWQRRRSLAIAMDSDGPFCVTYCFARLSFSLARFVC
nr:hypothetical protein Itr_chr04CG22050 [Ipomoea trifida]